MPKSGFSGSDSPNRFRDSEEAKATTKKSSNFIAQGKKTTITLALDDIIVKELRKDAEVDRTSLNSKVNFILERYISFYKYAELLGSVIIPEAQFKELLEIMDEKKLAEIMKSNGNANILSVFSNLGIQPELKSMNKFCFNRFIRWSGAYNSFSCFKDREGYACLVFEHKFGIKWSRVLAEALSDIIEQILQYPIEKKVMPATVVLRVMERGLKLDD